MATSPRVRNSVATTNSASCRRAFDDLLDDRVARLADAERENEDLNNSVVQLLQAVAQLSNKDLTAKAPVTANVIGTVSDSINLLAYETGRVLSEVTSIAAQVKLSTERVKRQGESVTATAAAERSDVERAGENLANANKVMTQVAELAAASNRAAEQATTSTVSALGVGERNRARAWKASANPSPRPKSASSAWANVRRKSPAS